MADQSFSARRFGWLVVATVVITVLLYMLDVAGWLRAAEAMTGLFP